MKVDDIVVRRRLPFTDLTSEQMDKAMRGRVVKVAKTRLAGSVLQWSWVKWDNQWESIGRHADRMLQIEQ